MGKHLAPPVVGIRSKALRPLECSEGCPGSSSTVQMARSEWLKGGPKGG